MKPNPLPPLSRREREIMEIVYALGGSAEINQVVRAMSDPPSRTAVRTMMRILDQKGHLSHRKQGRHFVYSATQPHGKVARSALRRLLGTFFGGSIEGAVAAYLSDPQTKVSADELKRLNALVDQARRKGG